MARKSTTPKADEKHAKFEAHWRSCLKVKGIFSDIFGMTCQKCGHQYKMGMSEYAFSRDANEYLLVCGCKTGSMVWFLASDRAKNAR